MNLVHIPTGHGQCVLCLQVHRDSIWAGEYATRAAQAPQEIGLAARRTGARRHGQALVVGGQHFALTRAQLRRAVAWLSAHGVHTKEARP